MYLEIQVSLTTLHMNITELGLFRRFMVDELLALVAILCIPDPIISPNCYSSSALEALTLTCARMHSPKYLWLQAAISQITHEVVSYINKAWGHLLKFNKDGVLTGSNGSIRHCATCAWGTHSHGGWLPRLHHLQDLPSEF